MREVLTRLGKVLTRKSQEAPQSQQQTPRSYDRRYHAIDPVTEPDRVRQVAFLTPGVVSGVVDIPIANGTIRLDFDNRDPDHYPSETFVPKEKLTSQ